MRFEFDDVDAAFAMVTVEADDRVSDESDRRLDGAGIFLSSLSEQVVKLLNFGPQMLVRG